MAKLSEVLAGKYLSGKDMEGRERDVTLDEITEEEMPAREDGGKPETKFVARFKGMRQRVVLNTTNLRMLSGLGIKETDQR